MRVVTHYTGGAPIARDHGLKPRPVPPPPSGFSHLRELNSADAAGASDSTGESENQKKAEQKEEDVYKKERLLLEKG